MFGLSKPEHKPVTVFIKLIAPSHKITPPLNYQAGTDTNQPQCTVKMIHDLVAACGLRLKVSPLTGHFISWFLLLLVSFFFFFFTILPHHSINS